MAINKTELHTVLRALMDSQHLSESELARRTGIGQPVIHRMLSGETGNPKIETLRPIASYFTLTINELIGDEPLPKDALSGTLGKRVPNWNRVPLLTWEQATQLPYVNHAECEQFVATDQDVSDNAYALTIKDSTMLPRFPENAIIIVDPAYTPIDRDFAIVHIDGHKQVTFKQILIDGEETYLKPLNPDFKVSVLDKKHRFLGVLVQARIDYKPQQSHLSQLPPPKTVGESSK